MRPPAGKAQCEQCTFQGTTDGRGCLWGVETGDDWRFIGIILRDVPILILGAKDCEKRCRIYEAASYFS
jgi:hypothetical protein